MHRVFSPGILLLVSALLLWAGATSSPSVTYRPPDNRMVSVIQGVVDDQASAVFMSLNPAHAKDFAVNTMYLSMSEYDAMKQRALDFWRDQYELANCQFYEPPPDVDGAPAGACDGAVILQIYVPLTVENKSIYTITDLTWDGVEYDACQLVDSRKLDSLFMASVLADYTLSSGVTVTAGQGLPVGMYRVDHIKENCSPNAAYLPHIDEQYHQSPEGVGQANIFLCDICSPTRDGCATNGQVFGVVPQVSAAAEPGEFFVHTGAQTFYPKMLNTGLMPLEAQDDVCNFRTTQEIPAYLDMHYQQRVATAELLDATITWAGCQSNLTDCQNRHVIVMNSDFASGTLRVKVPMVLLVGEDIVFHPNPSNDFLPHHGDPEYSDFAYTLGFFAAIAVEADDVVIDFQGHSIEQSVAFSLHQRFYAHIELSDRPFPAGSGPANFGSPLRPAHGAVVRNGTLGRTSHHGIHDNDASFVLLEDLVFHDYEVAAIATNGGHGSVFRRIHAQGVRQDVPVAATFSNAHFMHPFVGMALAYSNDTNPALEMALQTKWTHLHSLIMDVDEDVVNGGLVSVDKHTHPEAFALFGNPSGKFDGNTYGILLNSKGVAVNSFKKEFIKDGARSILLENVKVENTISNVQEVLSLEHVATGKIQLGPVGEVFRIESVLAQDGTYRGNALSDALLALAELVKALPAPMQAHFGTLNIHADLIQWSKGNVLMSDLIENQMFRVRRNGDTMNHLSKGTNAITITSATNICLKHVQIANTANLGPRGHHIALPGETANYAALYTGTNGDVRGHNDASNVQIGYGGADSRGIALVSSIYVGFDDVTIGYTSSDNGAAVGLDLINEVNAYRFHDVAIQGVWALTHIHTNDFHNGARAVGAMGYRGDLATLQQFGEAIQVEDVHCPVDGYAHDHVLV